MIDRIVGVILALIALASLGVVFSKRSNAAGVIGVIVTGLNNLFSTAVSPITKN